jgi:hypothetical protein
MGSRRNRMKVLDQRTGRLAYAIDMVEDGEIRGLYVRRGEDDQQHPQKFPKIIPPDRAQFVRKMYDADLEGSQLRRYVVGYSADPTTFAREGFPVLSLVPSYGTFTYTETDDLGYGYGGYGTFGYGGVV